MKTNHLEFALSDADDLRALAVLIAALNAQGVPYTLSRDKIAIALDISREGF